MLNQSWEEILRLQVWRHPKKHNQRVKVAVLGIGNAMHGDDAAGVQVAARLRDHCTDEHCLILDGSMAPENCTGQLRHFRPDWVLMIDAAEMGLQPGAIGWLPWQETAGISASTHTLPVHTLAQYLVQELNCQVALIGIQPHQTHLDAPLSPDVQKSVDQLVVVLAGWLQQDRGNLGKSLREHDKCQAGKG